MIYGAILGVIGIVLSLVFYFLNLYTKGWTSWVSLLITIVVLSYCLVAYRNEYLGGYASFGRIFVMGLVIGIIAAILSALWGYLLYTVIDPDLMEKVRVVTEERLLNNPRISDSMYEATMERLDRQTPGRTFIMGLIMGTVTNAIFSLIVAAFVKKEQSPTSDVV